MKNTTRTAWALVADSAGARLIECTRTPAGRCHVEERETLLASPRPHQHGRPTMTRSDGHTASADQHGDCEELRRFAYELAWWMKQKVREHDIRRLVLLAPSRFLGAARQTGIDLLAGEFREVHSELTAMDTAALARHTSIRTLLSPTNHPGRHDWSRQAAGR